MEDIVSGTAGSNLAHPVPLSWGGGLPGAAPILGDSNVRYAPLPAAAAALGVSPRRLQALCAQNRVLGARRRLGRWEIQVNEEGKPYVRPVNHGPKLGSWDDRADEGKP